MNTQEKLYKWFEKNFNENVSCMIFESPDGQGWVAFGFYQIKPANGKFQVWYYENLQAEFGDQRSALSYCIADRLQQVRLAREIQILDNKKQQLEADVGFARAQARQCRSADAREMILSKIQTKHAMQQVVTAELEKCVNSAKYLQLRGFSK